MGTVFHSAPTNTERASACCMPARPASHEETIVREGARPLPSRQEASADSMRWHTIRCTTPNIARSRPFLLLSSKTTIVTASSVAETQGHRCQFSPKNMRQKSRGSAPVRSYSLCPCSPVVGPTPYRVPGKLRETFDAASWLRKKDGVPNEQRQHQPDRGERAFLVCAPLRLSRLLPPQPDEDKSVTKAVEAPLSLSPLGARGTTDDRKAWSSSQISGLKHL